MTKEELFARIDEWLPHIRADVEEALGYYARAGLTEEEQVARFCIVAIDVARKLGLADEPIKGKRA